MIATRAVMAARMKIVFLIMGLVFVCKKMGGDEKGRSKINFENKLKIKSIKKKFSSVSST